MNYAAVVAAGVWVFATAYWFFPGIGGKTFFHGPPSEKPDVDVEVEQIIVRHEEAKKDRENSSGPNDEEDSDVKKTATFSSNTGAAFSRRSAEQDRAALRRI
jgi:hypothetical protein